MRVQQSAAVKGDVAAPRLALEEGATFNGSVEPAKTDAAIIVAAYRNKNAPARTRVTSICAAWATAAHDCTKS